MKAEETLGEILEVPEKLLADLDKIMSKKTRVSGVLQKVADMNERRIASVLHKINSNENGIDHVRGCLRKAIFSHEKQFLVILDAFPGDDEFTKAAFLARKIASVSRGFFLKFEKAREILRSRPPEKILSYLGYKDANDLLFNEDLVEVLSALRFIESEKWMHETFDAAYSSFTPEDFEEREIMLKVLGPKWLDVGKKFIEKKHHNVSHLKEFGVIFLNPIKMDVPGKFLRDFALLLHYFHEIEFYSKLFRKYAAGVDFAARLKSLLRGDVLMVNSVGDGEWLIVQQYLAKVNPADKRLLLPRVNPESLHWLRGERDLSRFALEYDDFDAELWHDLDWVGGMFEAGGQRGFVSFDLEDNVMSLVSFMEGREEFFSYHQREAMWTKIFSEYVGGEEETEKLLVENFEKGKIVI